MPISEQMFTGFATGAALAGHRAVVEFQIPALLYLAFEQIVNQAQKLRLMTGGQASVPVVYLVPGSGARLGLAAQHSDHPYSLFVHAGVKTVLPATASDAYGLLVSAIRDDDPVVFFAPAAALPLRDELPDEPYAIPLGSARIHREGTDVTVVAVGHLVHDALAVADELADEVSIEVFDPRTLYPFDWEPPRGVARAHGATRRVRRREPQLRLRRRDRRHGRRGDGARRAAAARHPGGRADLVRRRARARRAAEPRTAGGGRP